MLLTKVVPKLINFLTVGLNFRPSQVTSVFGQGFTNFTKVSEIVMKEIGCKLQILLLLPLAFDGIHNQKGQV